jgi:hypothetical protein
MENNKRYKNLTFCSIPTDYDYDTSELLKNGYTLRFRIDKYNPVKEEIINDLKNDKISYSIINHTKRKRMIDIWIKES